MKSPSNKRVISNMAESEQNNVEKPINEALDKSVEHLSAVTLSEIGKARVLALKHLNESKNKESLIDIVKAWLTIPTITMGIPAALAVIITISVKYTALEHIPELPLAMMITEVPNEDFAMLEDLEFVTWLVENEQSSLL